MSIEAMNWALEVDAGKGGINKLVLLILANRANHKGVCWPGFDGIARQACIARTTVIRAVKNLTDLGLITIQHRENASNIYTLNMGGSGALLVAESNVGSSGALPKPKTTQKNKKKRASFVDPDWVFTDALKAYAEKQGMTEQDIDLEVGKFRDHEFYRPKSDWNRAWQNWCRNWKEGRKKREAHNRGRRSVEEIRAANRAQYE